LQHHSRIRGVYESLIRPERDNGAVITEWRPEDPAFWEQRGHRVASRNLWISVPCLLLAFCVWMLFSAVAVNLPKVGFKFTTDQLFMLTALPSLSGALLRVPYAFMVPVWRSSLDGVQYRHHDRALRVARFCRAGYLYTV
jgi:hypothetical protein